MAKVTIRFKNQEKTYDLRDGLGFEALVAKCKQKGEDIPVEFDCREADCGICIFKVLRGLENLSDPTPAEADFLKAMRADADERLACQTRVLGDVSIQIEDHT